MDPTFREFIGHNALAIDLINIAPLDDLHHPKGMIKEAQDLAVHSVQIILSFLFKVQVALL